MFSWTDLFISAAQAADAVTPPATNVAIVGEPSAWVRFAPLFLIFIVFYVLLIRPQQKKLDEQNKMIKALKKGDKVITAAGFVGTVTKEEGEDYLMVEIAKDVQVKALRSTIHGLLDEKKALATNENKKN